MNGLPYYKRYPRDFFDGTVGMPFDLKAAYGLVLDLIYMQGGALPDDPRYISGLLGCSVRAWNGYRSELVTRGKIACENGIISNFRADKETISQRSFQDKQRQNATGVRKNKDLAKAVALPKQGHSRDYTEPEEEEEKREAKASPKKRGTRLPDDWFLPMPWGEWAIAEGYAVDVIRREAENFKDYWHSKAGPTATKLDWEATWRIWIRKSPKGNGYVNGTHQQNEQSDQFTRIVAKAALRTALSDRG